MPNQIATNQQGRITIVLDRTYAVALAMAVQDLVLAGGAPTEVDELQELILGSPEWQKGGPVGPITRGEVNEYRVLNNIPIPPL